MLACGTEIVVGLRETLVMPRVVQHVRFEVCSIRISVLLILQLNCSCTPKAVEIHGPFTIKNYPIKKKVALCTDPPCPRHGQP